MPTPVDSLEQGSSEGQIKAAVSDCIAQEMRNGKSQEQATAMCLEMAKQKAGDVLRLIPHAEKITKLSAFCQRCLDGTPAHFSKLIAKDIHKNDQTMVGGCKEYEAVCRKHYHT